MPLLKLNKMKALLPVIIVTTFVSCKKANDPNPTNPTTLQTFESFVGKYLVLDSFSIKDNVSTKMTVMGKGRGGDVKYFPDGTYRIYSSTEANPTQTIKNYKFQFPDRIYTWSPMSSMQTDQYANIISISGKHIVLKDEDLTSKQTRTFYHTAE